VTITKSVNLKETIIDVEVVKTLTPKDKLVLEAKELDIDTTDMTSAKLKEAIEAAKAE